MFNDEYLLLHEVLIKLIYIYLYSTTNLQVDLLENQALTISRGQVKGVSYLCLQCCLQINTPTMLMK